MLFDHMASDPSINIFRSFSITQALILNVSVYLYMYMYIHYLANVHYLAKRILRPLSLIVLCVCLQFAELRRLIIMLVLATDMSK